MKRHTVEELAAQVERTGENLVVAAERLRDSLELREKDEAGYLRLRAAFGRAQAKHAIAKRAHRDAVHEEEFRRMATAKARKAERRMAGAQHV